MGCRGSKEARAKKYEVSGGDDQEDAAAGGKAHAEPAAPVATQTAAREEPPAPKKKLDPADFRFIGGKGEVKIKEPGTINGQSFTIRQCTDCDIYVLDFCGQVTIDECSRCRIFIGPTDGSVFLRDSTDCVLVTVCRQLRTRDCRSCRLALLCRTRPIVESSTAMHITCFNTPYPQLEAHMRAAKLSPFQNFWWHVYDFTPKDGNWDLLPPADVPRDEAGGVLAPLPAEAAPLLLPPGEASPTLVTRGAQKPRPQGHFVFAAFPGAKQQAALELARKAAAQGALLHTNEVRLNAEAAGSLASTAGWPKAAAKALTAADNKAPGAVGLELCAPDEAAAEALRAEATAAGGYVAASEAAADAVRTAGVEG